MTKDDIKVIPKERAGAGKGSGAGGRGAALKKAPAKKDGPILTRGEMLRNECGTPCPPCSHHNCQENSAGACSGDDALVFPGSTRTRKHVAPRSLILDLCSAQNVVSAPRLCCSASVAQASPWLGFRGHVGMCHLYALCAGMPAIWRGEEERKFGPSFDHTLSQTHLEAASSSAAREKTYRIVFGQAPGRPAGADRGGHLCLDAGEVLGRA